MLELEICLVRLRFKFFQTFSLRETLSNPALQKMSR